MISRHRLLLCATVAAAALTAGTAAFAQDTFPSKEIRLVVPWNAGGSNDIAARALADTGPWRQPRCALGVRPAA